MPSYKFGFDSRLVRMGLKISKNAKKSSNYWPKLYSHYGGTQYDSNFWIITVGIFVSILIFLSIIYPVNRSITALCSERLALQKEYLKLYTQQNKAVMQYSQIILKARKKESLSGQNLDILASITQDLHMDKGINCLSDKIIQSIDKYDTILKIIKTLNLKRLKMAKYASDGVKIDKKYENALVDLSRLKLQDIDTKFIFDRNLLFHTQRKKNSYFYRYLNEKKLDSSHPFTKEISSELAGLSETFKYNYDIEALKILTWHDFLSEVTENDKRNSRH